MIEREITMTVAGDRLIPSARVLGYAGEHLATRLQFIFPEDWIASEEMRYYAAYDVLSTGKRYRTDDSTWPLEAVLPQAVMAEGKVVVQVNAVALDDNEELHIVKSAACTMLVEKAIKDVYDEIESLEGLLEGSIIRFNEKVDELDGIIDTVQISALHMENKSNPHQVSAAQAGAVPVERTVNGKALSEDITLQPGDIGAVPDSRTVNEKPLSADITLTAEDVGARPNDWLPAPEETGGVPVTRAVNGKPLSANITLTAEDVGARPDGWMPAAEETGAVPAGEKGAANGVATLDENGKLVQTPTAEDVGARPNDWLPTPEETGAVPAVRTVNGKPLSADVSLTAADVGARPDDWVPTAAQTGAVPTTRKVNGKALSADISLAAADVSAVPTSRTVNGKALSANISLAAADVGAVPTSRTVNGKALSANVSLSASDVSALPTSGGTISGKLNFSGTSYPHIYGNGSNLQLSWGNNATVGVVLGGGNFRDAGDATLNLGNSAHRWATIFAAVGTINTSDRNYKNTIADMDPQKAEKLIMGLKPSTYKLNDGTSGRTHWGMISQDIEELFPKIGMTDMDFAGFIKSPKTEDYYEDVSEVVMDEETGEEKTVTRKELKSRVIEGEYLYSLRYDEFIAPLICMVQKQQKQIEAQQNQIQSLEQRLSAIEAKENSL